jgi:hypothetical protein
MRASPKRRRSSKAEYEWPFQSHASMGPGCAVADVEGRRNDHEFGPGTQKPHFAAQGCSGLPRRSRRKKSTRFG